MSNLLDQWNDHIIRGNQLSRELENIETLIEKSKGEDICFTSKPNGSTYITVLSPEQMQRLREEVIISIMQARNDKTAELEKLMGIRKPATVNPVFEAAMQSMNQSGKPKPKPDPVEVKLDGILKAEAKKIEDKPIELDPSADKYPAKKSNKSLAPEAMTEEAVKKLYWEDGKTIKQIAEHFGVRNSTVNNFIYLHKLSRNGSKFKEVKKPEPVKEKCDNEKCHVCGKEIDFSGKINRNMWPYKYQRRSNGNAETVYCCGRPHFIDGKAKDI